MIPRDLEVLLAAERARGRALEDEIRRILAAALAEERERVEALEGELQVLRDELSKRGEDSTQTERAFMRQDRGLRRVVRQLKKASRG
jgi:plasmid stability protein